MALYWQARGGMGPELVFATDGDFYVGDVIEVQHVLWRVGRNPKCRTVAQLEPMPTAHVRGTGGVVADVLAGMLYVAASNLLDKHDDAPVKPAGTGYVTCLCPQCFAACGVMGEYELGAS